MKKMKYVMYCYDTEDDDNSETMIYNNERGVLRFMKGRVDDWDDDKLQKIKEEDGLEIDNMIYILSVFDIII